LESAYNVIRKSMKIIKHIRSDWFRYGFETLAVIVGILIAFALENWHDTQLKKEEEYEILVDLLNDLQDAKKLSSEFTEVEMESRAYLIDLLNYKLSSSSMSPQLFPDSIFYKTIWDVGMEIPVINSYRDIKNTGKTGLITNEMIRKSFTNLEIGIINLGIQVEDRLRVQQLRFDAMLITDLNFVRMVSIRIPEVQSNLEPENDYRLFLENQRIRNMIAMKLSLTHEVIEDRRKLQAEIQSLITMLENEIEEINDSPF